jgi:hypothetical protein
MMDFITQLQKNIYRQKKIYENPKLFVLSKKLKQFHIRKNATAKDLPMELCMGSVYFIGKCGSIFEFYSWVDYNVSMSIKINICQFHWLSTITTHKINAGDFDVDLYDWLTKYSSLTNYNKPSQVEVLAMNLVRAGFKIWLLP